MSGGSRPGSSGGSSSPFAGSSPFSRPGSSPSSGLFSRFGSRATYDYLPLHDALIMFDLRDVCAAVYERLSLPIPQGEDEAPNPADIKPLIAALEKDRTLHDQIREWITDSWTQFNLIGAVHIYDWREEVKNAANNRLQSAKLPPKYIRATDPAFVLNVLVRARSYLLIPDAAVALDRPFLERIIMSDDPRLIKFARETAFTDDLLVEPPPPIDDSFDTDDLELDDDDDGK